MEKDTLEQLFSKLDGTFNQEEPNQGHQKRFLDKLNASNKVSEITLKHKTYWLTYISIAAAIALLMTLGFFQLNVPKTLDEQVAQISPEASKTQFYFANLIEEQVRALHSEESPETKKIIEDTMSQLKKLELNYSKMEQDLVRGGNTKLILSAMITNFQTRIDLLNEVMIQIETIKNIKYTNNENYTI